MSSQNTGKVKPFIPCEGIVSPCASIEVHRRVGQERVVTVRMLFSGIVGQPKKDLLLTFTGVIALAMADELVGVMEIPVSEGIPKLSDLKWRNFRFPLLIHEGSAWAQSYRNALVHESEKRHFVLLSLDVTLHVLADPTATTQWVDAATTV